MKRTAIFYLWTFLFFGCSETSSNDPSHLQHKESNVDSWDDIPHEELFQRAAQFIPQDGKKEDYNMMIDVQDDSIAILHLGLKEKSIGGNIDLKWNRLNDQMTLIERGK